MHAQLVVYFSNAGLLGLMVLWLGCTVMLNGSTSLPLE